LLALVETVPPWMSITPEKSFPPVLPIVSDPAPCLVMPVVPVILPVPVKL
jgi:hypothetical protein